MHRFLRLWDSTALWTNTVLCHTLVSGSGSFVSEYDSAESIYHSFFAELEEAVNILYAYGLQGKPVRKQAILSTKAMPLSGQAGGLPHAKIGDDESPIRRSSTFKDLGRKGTCIIQLD